MSHDAEPRPDPRPTPFSQDDRASARDEHALSDPAQERIAMELRQLFASIPIPTQLTSEGARAVRSRYERARQRRVQVQSEAQQQGWSSASRNGAAPLRDRAPLPVSATPAPAESSATASMRRYGRRWPWILSGSVAALVAVLVAILFGALFWFARPSAPLRQGAVPACRDTVGDITLSVSQTYADATRTLVRFHTNRIDAAYPTWLALIDAQGNRYPALTVLEYHIYSEGFIEFAPLPASALAGDQQLILYAPEMENPQDSERIIATGPWSTCFHLTPQRGVARALDIAPMTSHGVTIQPQLLEVAPAGSSLDALAGGARITVSVSGLDPATSVMQLQHFGGRIETGPRKPPYNETSVTDMYPGPGEVSLDILATVGPVLASGAYVPTTTPPTDDKIVGTELEIAQRQTVGKSGAIDLQLIFFGPLALSSDARATLRFNTLPITLVQPNGSYVERPLDGAWEFQLPLALKSS